MSKESILILKKRKYFDFEWRKYFWTNPIVWQENEFVIWIRRNLFSNLKFCTFFFFFFSSGIWNLDCFLCRKISNLLKFNFFLSFQKERMFSVLLFTQKGGYGRRVKEDIIDNRLLQTLVRKRIYEMSFYFGITIYFCLLPIKIWSFTTLFIKLIK